MELLLVIRTVLGIEKKCLGKYFLNEQMNFNLNNV